MASERDHISLANGNHATLLYLLAEVEHHHHWVATVAFYKAVHVVEAVFDRERGWHSQSHGRRLESLKQLRRYRPLHKHFRTLYGISRVARYLEDEQGGRYSSFTDLVPANRVEEEIVYGLLKPVEDNAVQFLGDDSRARLLRIAKL